jgi:hypothetical protein
MMRLSSVQRCPHPNPRNPLPCAAVRPIHPCIGIRATQEHIRCSCEGIRTHPPATGGGDFSQSPPSLRGGGLGWGHPSFSLCLRCPLPNLPPATGGRDKTLNSLRRLLRLHKQRIMSAAMLRIGIRTRVIDAKRFVRARLKAAATNVGEAHS